MKSNSASDDDSEEEEQQMTQEQKNTLLLKAVKENNVDDTIEAIKLGADPNFEENSWNAILWAACNGNEDIVRVLIKN